MKPAQGNSAEAAIQAHLDVARGPIALPPQVRLRKGDKPFWDAILKARARDEWNEVDLALAAQLARCQRDIEVASRKRDITVKVVNGRKVVIDRVDVVNRLSQREMALMRSLRMGGKVAGDPRSEAGRRAAQTQAYAVREELEEERLLQ